MEFLRAPFWALSSSTSTRYQRLSKIKKAVATTQRTPNPASPQDRTTTTKCTKHIVDRTFFQLSKDHQVVQDLSLSPQSELYPDF